jgi:hypothetical protein
MKGKIKRKDHMQAEEKYRILREISYESTMEEFPGIKVKGITYDDALTADSWKLSNEGNQRVSRGSWIWTKEYPFYKNQPNRFEVSLWKSGILCALCYGQLSKHGTRVRMNLIESTPVRPSPLGMQALPILSVAAATFANIAGASELWVLDPDPKIESLYKAQGFGGVEIYHGRRVGQRRIL